MAKLIFAMNQSLDGYVDHEAMAPSPARFRHWIENQRGLAGSIYGRRMYQIMRYWDEDDPSWDAERREFASVWPRLAEMGRLAHAEGGRLQRHPDRPRP
jgi:hypothetical protein